jgi:hypothetical protein
VAGLTALFALAAAVPASAQTGGTPPPGGTEPTTTTPAPTGPPGKAKLRKDGTAPPAVQSAIAAGNAIRTMPYRWGGGHRSFSDTGYDCSGAVSYVLNAAGMLASPMPSGPLMAWGLPGKGYWITVFSNPSHVYMKVAGLRFDTSAVGEKLNQGSGPRWRKTKRKATGYVVRHFQGY